MPNYYQSLLEQMIRVEDLVEQATVPQLLGRLAGAIEHERLGIVDEHLDIVIRTSRSGAVRRLAQSALSGRRLRALSLASADLRASRSGPAAENLRYLFLVRHAAPMTVVVAGDRVASSFAIRQDSNLMMIFPDTLDYAVIHEPERGAHAVVIEGVVSDE